MKELQQHHQSSTSRPNIVIEEEHLVRILSYLNLYDAYAFIPQVCKEWRRVFEYWSAPSRHLCDEQIEALKYISKDVLRDYQIWRYCECHTPEQFQKIVEEKQKKLLAVDKYSLTSPKPISKRHSKNGSFLTSWLRSSNDKDNGSDLPSLSSNILMGSASGETRCVFTRVLFVGKNKVGKSHLYRAMQTKKAYTQNSRTNSLLPMSREFNVKGRQYSIQLIDSRNSKDIQCDMTMLCFDMTDVASFEYIKDKWASKKFSKKQKVLGQNTSQVLIGLKHDKRAIRKVSRKEAEDFAHSHLKCIYVEVSSHKYTGVSQLYTYILFQQIYQEHLNILVRRTTY
jgi:hypothetical protein